MGLFPRLLFFSYYTLWILALTKGSLFSCFCVIELALDVVLTCLPQYLSFDIPDDLWFLHRTILRTVVMQAKSRCVVISALLDSNPTYEDTIIFFFASQSWLKKYIRVLVQIYSFIWDMIWIECIKEAPWKININLYENVFISILVNSMILYFLHH